MDWEQPQASAAGLFAELRPAAASAYSAGLVVDEAPDVEDWLAAAFFSTMLTGSIEFEEMSFESTTPEVTDRVVSFIGIAGTWTGTGSLTCPPNAACRVCQLDQALARILPHLRARPVGAAFCTAIGLAIPSIEAWLRCGVDTPFRKQVGTISEHAR